MNVEYVISAVLSLVAGIGVFLIGCHTMSANLEELGSNKLNKWFKRATTNTLAGVGVGTLATAVVQSSSAITVMVIGFVNAGIMTLAQAAGVIFGANIGTTVTGQIVALGRSLNGGITLSSVLAAFAGVGALVMLFAKREKAKHIGGIMAGLGMLFVGLSQMSGAMSGFAQLQEVKNFLAGFSSVYLLVLTGAVITAIVQSSSAITSMALTMLTAGLISLNQGVYIIIGSNIGTCVTALFAGFTSGLNAKRASLLHLIFNLSGAILFMVAGIIMRAFGTDYGQLLAGIFGNAPQLELAFFHTIFNVITVIAVLPLTSALVKLSTRLVPARQIMPLHGEEE
jgi:phosphate:Na+ symporter